MNLNNESKTLLLCLKAKSEMSKLNFLIKDRKAEEIMENIKIDLKQSKYLSMFLTLRAKLMDDAILKQINEDSVVLHYGCGLDTRYFRIKPKVKKWYDIDFANVIALKKQYVQEDERYQMIDIDHLNELETNNHVVLIMEGVSMYMNQTSLKNLFDLVANKYQSGWMIIDVYTTLGVKLSKYKNPVNQFQAKITYGVDEKTQLELNSKFKVIKDYPIKTKTNDFIFNQLYCGKTALKLTRIYELKMEE